MNLQCPKLREIPISKVTMRADLSSILTLRSLRSKKMCDSESFRQHKKCIGLSEGLYDADNTYLSEIGAAVNFCMSIVTSWSIARLAIP